MALVLTAVADTDALRYGSIATAADPNSESVLVVGFTKQVGTLPNTNSFGVATTALMDAVEHGWGGKSAQTSNDGLTADHRYGVTEGDGTTALKNTAGAITVGAWHFRAHLIPRWEAGGAGAFGYIDGVKGVRTATPGTPFNLTGDSYTRLAIGDEIADDPGGPSSGLDGKASHFACFKLTGATRAAQEADADAIVSRMQNAGSWLAPDNIDIADLAATLYFYATLKTDNSLKIGTATVTQAGTGTFSTADEPPVTEAGGAIVVVGGLVAETGAVFAGAGAKTFTGGLVNETGALFTGAGAKTFTGGLASETGAVFAGAHARTFRGGLASEADTVFSASGAKRFFGGLVTEADLPFSGAGRKTFAAGVAIEADSALPGGQKKTFAGGLVPESDAVFSGAGAKRFAGGLASETDTAFARIAIALSPSPDRTLAANSENRLLAIPAESRLHAITVENRLHAVAAENRLLAIPSENRTLK